jgi:DNA repair protein RadC
MSADPPDEPQCTAGGPPAAPAEKANKTHLKDLIPKDALPREKFERLGFSSLSDTELLALIFGTGTEGLNVLEMSRLLVDQYGSITQLSRLDWREFQAIKGIGPAKAKHLAAVFELGKRLAYAVGSSQVLDTSKALFSFVGPEMQAESREIVKVILLNSRKRLISVETVLTGAVAEVQIEPMAIVRPAIIQQAPFFVLVHNHPSGDPHPSESDHRLTRRIKEVSRLLGLGFLDHLIIGQPMQAGRLPFFSFSDCGLMH